MIINNPRQQQPQDFPGPSIPMGPQAPGQTPQQFPTPAPIQGGPPNWLERLTSIGQNIFRNTTHGQMQNGVYTRAPQAPISTPPPLDPVQSRLQQIMSGY
jgi:hypothetical protein